MLSLKVLLLLVVLRDKIMAYDYMAYDLCVVGAGLFGSAAARHASANPDIKVCLIGPPEPKPNERQNREIFGAYYDVGRITSVLAYWSTGVWSPQGVLTRESLKRYRELEKLSGIKFYTPIGYLNIVQKNGEFIEKLLEVADSENFPITELDRETFEMRYPYLTLKENETAFLDDNSGGHISPRQMVKAQQKVAKLQGCDIIKSVVSGITLVKSYYKITTENNITITAKRIIVATGAFINTKTFDVLKPLKVTKSTVTASLLKIPREEVKRLSSMPDFYINGRFDETYEKEISIFILPPILYPDGHYYIKSGVEGYEGEAHNLDEIRKWYLSAGDKKQVDMENNIVKKSIPGIRTSGYKPMTCVYGMTPTGLPYIDRISPTLTVALGGNGFSAKSSDEIGRLAAHLCITGDWDSELRQARFKAIFQQ